MTRREMFLRGNLKQSIRHTATRRHQQADNRLAKNTATVVSRWLAAPSYNSSQALVQKVPADALNYYTDYIRANDLVGDVVNDLIVRLLGSDKDKHQQALKELRGPLNKSKALGLTRWLSFDIMSLCRTYAQRPTALLEGLNRQGKDGETLHIIDTQAMTKPRYSLSGSLEDAGTAYFEADAGFYGYPEALQDIVTSVLEGTALTPAQKMRVSRYRKQHQAI